MITAVPKKTPSLDEIEILSSMPNLQLLGRHIFEYQKIVQETAPFRQSLRQKKKLLNKRNITPEDLASDPGYKEASIVINATQDSIKKAVTRQSSLSDNIHEDLRKIIKGTEYIRGLQYCDSFLDETDQNKLANIESLLNKIEEDKIFLKHSRENWPKQLNKKNISQAFEDYKILIEKTYKYVKNPVVHESKASSPLIPLNHSIGSDHELRRQALFDLHIPEALKSNERLLTTPVKLLTGRINGLLKRLDNDPKQFDAFTNMCPDILVDGNVYSNFVRRLQLLNTLADDSKNPAVANYDDFLASALREKIMPLVIDKSDKEFFEFYRKVRLCLEEDRSTKKGYDSYIEIDDKFMDRLIPKPTHPFSGNPDQLTDIVKFLGSKEVIFWLDNSITQDLMRKAILLKLASPNNVSSSKEDWIKANFSKAISSIVKGRLEAELDNLIKDDQIVEQYPGKSKSPIRLK